MRPSILFDWWHNDQRRIKSKINTLGGWWRNHIDALVVARVVAAAEPSGLYIPIGKSRHHIVPLHSSSTDNIRSVNVPRLAQRLYEIRTDKYRQKWSTTAHGGSVQGSVSVDRGQVLVPRCDPSIYEEA